MAAGHRSPPTNNRTIDKNLDEAQSTGSLDLSSRKLNEFPKSADSYDLTDTVEADISKNRFTEIPHEICQLVQLEKLSCYHNAIRSLPESLLRMQYLSYLDLSRNQLSHIPAFLCKLQSLEVMILSNNRIVSVPEEIGELTGLMELDVGDNEITTIPKQLGELKELKILNLRKNLLIELPEELSGLKLKSLDFSCNKIQEIPIEFRHMDSLEELILDSNPLISPPAHTCTKGRVHILKYLQILAIREDKRRGVLSETGFNRNTLRRSFQKDEIDTVRLRRRAVVSTDSGYVTDNPNRWANMSTSNTGATTALENGLDGALKAAEALKEQRAERHLELQKRISSAELHSPNRSAFISPGRGSGTPMDTTLMSPVDSTGGSISPLKVTAGIGSESGEDMFSKELQRQKQDYEQRKKRAEQVKSEGGVRRSGKPPTPQTTPTSSASLHSPGAGVPSSRTSQSAGGSNRPPQPPIRSASVHAESRTMLYSEKRTTRPAQLPVSSMVRHNSLPRGSIASAASPSGHNSVSMHGYNYGGVVSNGYGTPMHTTPPTSTHPSFYQSRTAPRRSRDEQQLADLSLNGGHGKNSDAGGNILDRSTSDSYRSSPTSLSSQDGDGRLSVGSSIASSSTQEVTSHSKTTPTSATNTSRSDNSTPRRTSAVSGLGGSGGPDSVDTPSSRQHPSSKSASAVPGFQAAGSVGRPVSGTHAPSTTNGTSSHAEKTESHRGPQSNSSDSQYIAKIREIIESRLKVTLPHGVMTELRDGVVLCHLANYVKPRTVSQIHVKSSAVPKLTMAKCKRNVENFIDACKRLGVPQDCTCSTSDILEEKRPAPLCKTIQTLIDIKASSKVSHSSSPNGQSSVGSRSTPSRSRSGLATGARSASAQPHSRTNSSSSHGRRSQNTPLHSVV